MTASEKLTQLIKDDKLTEKQRDNLYYFGILTVSELRDDTINLISVKDETRDIDYASVIHTLYDLPDYDNDDEYVVFDEYENGGIHKLDFSTLIDALTLA